MFDYMTVPLSRRQAVIDDGLEYLSGILEQACAACDWEAGYGDTREGTTCPQCGEQLEPPRAIRFGGLRVIYRDWKNAFIFEAPYCGRTEVRVYQRDVQEVLTFMARRFKPSERRSLPALSGIERLFLVARAAIDSGEPDLARETLNVLLDELNPRRDNPQTARTRTLSS